MPLLQQCYALTWYTVIVIANFVSNVVAMATGVTRYLTFGVDVAYTTSSAQTTRWAHSASPINRRLEKSQRLWQ